MKALLIYTAICGSLFFHQLLACDLSTIKTEISKYHGTEWGSIIPPCKKETIKTHLNDIIRDPRNVLKEFTKEHQAFLYRNAVQSYGHFATTDADVHNLSNLFNEQNGNFEKYFKDSSKFAKLIVLESIANTGSPEGLDFFKQILENEDSELFYQNSAAEYALWILDGVPKSVYEREGNGLNYYPNISTNARQRFADDDAALIKLREVKVQMNTVIETLLADSNKYGKISTNLNRLKESLNREDFGTSFNSGQSDKTNGNFREPKSVDNKDVKNIKGANRKISSNNSSDESTSQKSTFWLLVIAALFIGITILFLVLNKKRQ